jgi:hypothetical protein
MVKNNNLQLLIQKINQRVSGSIRVVPEERRQRG